MRKYFPLSTFHGSTLLTILRLWKDFQLLFWAIIIIGIGLRVYYMVAPVTKLSADEAVYGVQALNILHGERSVFYYNQNYTGTLSAFISAILFAVFGVSAILVKLPVFIFSIFFLITSYYLAKIVFNSKNYALLVLLLTSFTSPFWMNWTTRAGSGYPETMVLGNLIFILVLKNVFQKQTTRFQTLTFFLIGFLGGLGYWIQPTIIYYLLPAAVIIFFWKPKIFFTRLFLVSVLGFVLGSLPVIVFNLNHQNLNTQSLFHKPFGVKSAMVNFFSVGLPVIWGLRKPFSSQDLSIPVTVIVSLTYLAGIIMLVVGRLKPLLQTFSFGLVSRERKLDVAVSRLAPIDLLLLFLATVFVVFSFSSPFNQFVSEPRYISPLYTVLPILIVYLIKKLNKTSMSLGIAVLLIILGSQVFGLVKIPVDSFVSQIDLKQTIQTLKDKEIKYVDTQAFIAYHLILETRGEIIAATRDNPPLEARYPLYRKQVDGAPLEKKGLLIDSVQPLVVCEADLVVQGGPCKIQKLDNGLYLYTWR